MCDFVSFPALFINSVGLLNYDCVQPCGIFGYFVLEKNKIFALRGSTSRIQLFFSTFI